LPPSALLSVALKISKPNPGSWYNILPLSKRSVTRPRLPENLLVNVK
jgi:hypothetical protein